MSMDIRNHINLLRNHGYKGWIAVYKGRNTLSLMSGAVVMVKDEPHYEPDHNRDTEACNWLNVHRTVEVPYSQQTIEENLAKGSLIKTFCTTVGVRLRDLEQIHI